MKAITTIAAAITLVLITSTTLAEDPPDPSLSAPNGDPVNWGTWLEDHGPAAVVLWGSWIPDSDSVLAAAREMQAIAADRGIEFVVVALQEGLDDSRDAIGARKIPWLHDRHGTLLKVFKVYTIPALVLVSEDGAVLSRLEASPSALQEWQGP